MKSRTPTQRRSNPDEQARLRAVPTGGQLSKTRDQRHVRTVSVPAPDRDGSADPGPSAAPVTTAAAPITVAADPITTAAEFSETVRIVLSVARRLQLETPVFRSPPRAAGVDRTIQRRVGSTVIAIRRGTRPLAAIRADVIEGVVVANYLDPEQANEFRGLSWSALEAGVALSSGASGAGSSSSDSIHEAVPSHREAA